MTGRLVDSYYNLILNLTSIERGYDIGYFFFISKVAEMFNYHFYLKNRQKCLCEYFMLFCSFGYRGKVIIKCVSNIVGNGYNIESDHYQERKRVELVCWMLLFLEK